MYVMIHPVECRYSGIMNQILDFTYVALGDVSPANNRLLLAAFGLYVAVQEYCSNALTRLEYVRDG